MRHPSRQVRRAEARAEAKRADDEFFDCSCPICRAIMGGGDGVDVLAAMIAAGEASAGFVVFFDDDDDDDDDDEGEEALAPPRFDA